MKTLFCSVLFLLLYTSLWAQVNDSSYQKKNITTLDVEAFFSLYTQEGIHSAVTGGEGDEHLEVYRAGANIAYGINSSLVIFDASVDIITSPSTDKIDIIQSSASLHDRHVQAKIGYQHELKKQSMLFGAAYLFGIESDYLSNGIALWYSVQNKLKTRSFSVATDFFFDDLRWGRVNSRTNFQPVRLIYPFELRSTEWFDIYHRNSYNANFNLRQDINKRLTTNFTLGVSFQEGLLSTPFHRIYFSDINDARVENLPRQRIRLPLSVSSKWFVNNYLVFQPSYRIYWDNFGVFAHTLHLQLAIKPNPKFSLYPFVRAYYQTASYYFAPYKTHLSTEQYYSSDYELSSFWTFKGGLGLGWYPDARLGKKSKFYFNNIVLRYSFFYRTDGLSAHTVSLQFGLKK